MYINSKTIRKSYRCFIYIVSIPVVVMAKQKCFDCKKEFESTSNARFPRKYCLKCSAKKKKMWENQWKVKFEDLDD